MKRSYTRRRGHKHKTQTKRRSRTPEQSGRILLPNQLFPREYIPEPAKRVIVTDHEWFTDEKPFNKLTLFHRFVTSSQYATTHGYHRVWLGNHPKSPFAEACRVLKRDGVHTIKMFDPIDKPLVKNIQQVCRKHNIHLVLEESPAFTETNEQLDAFLKEHPASKRKTPDGKHTVNGYNHDVFYRWNRQRLGLLMKADGKSPLGGKWTYDTENRKPFPKTLAKDPTTLVTPGHSKDHGLSSKTVTRDVSRILRFIQERYTNNPGTIDTTNPATAIQRAARYPLTREKALHRLRTFFKQMLPSFGPYEDAFRHEGVPYGYHSVLSSSLNNGLITPEDVLKEVRKAPTKNLASLEGFVRQVFGWRAYTRMVYREERETLVKSNYLGHTKRLPRSWFRKDSPPPTGIEWLDVLFRDATERCYAHHIVRLMVFSQWFLLMRIRPLDVLDWFWAVVSIDAYEWVMVPNVLGMGQFADGGIMMRRPYVSASAYLKRMSGNTLPKGEEPEPWDDGWDALYYSFLNDHKAKLGKIYAYARSYAYSKKQTATKRKQWDTTAKRYIKGTLP